MKTLLGAAVALMIATTAQAETTLDNCRNATNDMSFIYAYNRLCGGVNAGHDLDNKMGVLQLRGCTKKVSLDEIRLAISRDVETLSQLKYQANDPYFCTSNEVIKERDDAMTDFLSSTR